MAREPIRDEGAEYLFGQLKKHETNFADFSARYSATFTTNKKQTSFSGQLRILRDSIIWVSISPALGIEVARIMITQDSIKMMNRIEEAYYQSDIQYINKLLNATLDFDMFQAFLLGNDFSFYENGKFKADISNKNYHLSTANRSKLKKYLRKNETEVSIPLQQIWLDPETFKIIKIIVKELESGGRKIEANYTDFEVVAGQTIPTKAEFRVETEELADFTLEYSKIAIDQAQSFPFSIPSKYKEKQF